MRHSAYFCRDIRHSSSKLRGREAGIEITSGSGISCFYGAEIRDSQGNRVGYGISIPLFACFWNLGVRAAIFFSHFAFASRTTDQRKKDTSKIDQRKNHQLAETNLLCLLCVWLCEQECLHSEKNVLSPNFKDRDDAESFEINCNVCSRTIFRIWE